METVDRTIRYLFVLAFVLIIVAYYAGANTLLKSGLAGVNTLDLTATGRNAAGKFGAYPTGA